MDLSQDKLENATLAGVTTQTLALPAGTVGTLALTVDPGISGGDIIDLAIHDPNVVISVVRPDSVVVNAANASSFGYVFASVSDGGVLQLPVDYYWC